MRAPTKMGWTPEQVARLESLIDSGASAVRAASALKRSVISVQTRVRLMGKPFLHKRKVKRIRLAKEAAAILRL
jgi:hypothetical protein